MRFKFNPTWYYSLIRLNTARVEKMVYSEAELIIFVKYMLYTQSSKNYISAFYVQTKPWRWSGDQQAIVLLLLKSNNYLLKMFSNLDLERGIIWNTMKSDTKKNVLNVEIYYDDQWQLVVLSDKQLPASRSLHHPWVCSRVAQHHCQRLCRWWTQRTTVRLWHRKPCARLQVPAENL